MKTPIHPLVKHADHPVQIKPSPFAKHYAQYYCLQCNKHIAWLSKTQALEAEKLGLISYV